MTDERLAELQEKYKNRNLFEELAWGIYANHSGYTPKQDGEFLNWLCLMAYKALKERPTGDWKDLSDKYFHACSICNKVIFKNSFDNFCPNCGAKMFKDDVK